MGKYVYELHDDYLGELVTEDYETRNLVARLVRGFQPTIPFHRQTPPIPKIPIGVADNATKILRPKGGFIWWDGI